MAALGLVAPGIAWADDTDSAEQTEYGLADGVNIISDGQSDAVFNVGDGQALMIANQNSDDPIVFENCTFNLSGETVKISGTQTDANGNSISYNGEVVTKLWISGNVEFKNCTFVTAEGATKTTSAGYDAAIYFYSGDINLYDCKLSAEGYNGQFLGLYGSDGAVTFDNCDISTVNNKNGWSYAMYAGSVLKLVNGSSMSATGSSTDSSNINCFYSGDNKTGYDAIYIEDSTIDFSDNSAGGFAINNVNIYVTNSTIMVNNNLGNACNSGYWIVENSTIQMNGNRGGHALSCIGFEMTDSTLDIEHNGYAGVYIQSKDSSLTNCTVDILCNGENLLSYTAGDLWLNSQTLTVDNCTSTTQDGSAWLGAVGRKGSVVTTDGTTVVAYDLNSNAEDNLKSNTEAVLTSATIAGTASHTLLLNPFMTSDYARGNAETTSSDNDADLFEDDNVTSTSDILGSDNAKIGSLTEAQLSHHVYDWANGTVKYTADEDNYGAMAYACIGTCDDYLDATSEHPYSFNCGGTYVYAPLVGLTFDANVDDDSVTNLPETQDTIAYEGTAETPTSDPVRESTEEGMRWEFTGWYVDAECTEEFDFTSGLTDNWTIVYAGWELVEDEVEEPDTPGTPDKPDKPSKPTQPEDPDDPEDEPEDEPEDPDVPDEPEDETEEPEDPEDPEETDPVNPDEEEPADTEEPVESEEPTDAEEPSDTITPEQPTETEETDEPELPATGDDTSYLPVVGAMTGGVALVAAGFVLRRRMSR